MKAQAARPELRASDRPDRDEYTGHARERATRLGLQVPLLARWQRRSPDARAFSFVELVVVVATLALLAVLFLPAAADTRSGVGRLNCANNLKLVGLAFRAWADDHGGRYPMRVPVAEGGVWGNPQAVPSASAGACPQMYLIFAVLSNELRTPRLVVCPSDARTARTNFLTGGTTGDFLKNNAVSYFVGRDCDETQPRMLLSGDRNIYGPTTAATANGGYGNSPNTDPSLGAVVALNTNISANATTPGWTDKMHWRQGNVLRADGSVDLFDSPQLREALRKTGDPTSPVPNVILFP